MLRIALIVSSFPSPDHSHGGIFNYRAAVGLRRLVHLTVVHLRAWKPTHPRRRTARLGDLGYTVLSAPVLPHFIPDSVANSIAFYSRVCWPAIRSLVNNCDLLHSIGTSFAGVLTSQWARWSHVPHVAQAVGTDVNCDLPRYRGYRTYRNWESHVHGVACNSDALAGAFRRLYPRVPNARTLYRGVGLAAFSPAGDANDPLTELRALRVAFLGGIADRRDLPARRDYKAYRGRWGC